MAAAIAKNILRGSLAVRAAGDFEQIFHRDVAMRARLVRMVAGRPVALAAPGLAVAIFPDLRCGERMDYMGTEISFRGAGPGIIPDIARTCRHCRQGCLVLSGEIGMAASTDFYLSTLDEPRGPSGKLSAGGDGGVPAFDFLVEA